MSLLVKILTALSVSLRKGSETSGNFGHEGIPGEQGGSAPGGGFTASGKPRVDRTTARRQFTSKSGLTKETVAKMSGKQILEASKSLSRADKMDDLKQLRINANLGALDDESLSHVHASVMQNVVQYPSSVRVKEIMIDTEAHMGSEAYASYSYAEKKMRLNEKYFLRMGAGGMNAMAEDGVNQKWAPEGCTTVKSWVDHEFGHSLRQTGGIHGWPVKDAERYKKIEAAYLRESGGRDKGETRERSRDWEKSIKHRLSAYATANAREYMAEAWSEYCNNPNPRPLALEVATHLKRTIR